MRKFIFIAALAIVLIGLGVFAYVYFKSNNAGLVVDEGVNPFSGVGGSALDNAFDTNGDGFIDGSEYDALGGATNEATLPTQITARLTKITPGPVALGSVVIDTGTTTQTATSSTPEASFFTNIEVRYAMKGSGNLYAYAARDGKSTRISNRTIPGAQEVSWLADGSIAYIRFLATDPDKSEHIETYALSSDGATGSFITRDLIQALISGSRLLTLSQTTNGTNASLSAPDGTGARTVFSSPISSLLVSFFGSDLVATTKASALQPGYIFTVSGVSGVFSRALGPLAGLSSTANPKGGKLLYSYVDGSAIRFAAYDATDHTSIPLPVQTLADKCVFSPDGQTAYCGVPTVIPSGTLPDAWYQGTASFTDKIWKVDFNARVATLVADLPRLTKEPIDAINLSLNPRGTALVFTNKRDGSLWIYAI